MEIEKFKCISCGKTLSVNREYIEMISMGIESIIENSEIIRSDKVVSISEDESGSNFGKVILKSTDIISSILNNIFICCPYGNWKSIQEEENINEDILALPPSIHRENIRNSLSNRRWQRITDETRKKADYICQNCKTNMKDNIAYLHSHEDWLLDYDNKTAELVGIKVLCDMCHMYYHQGLYGIQRFENKINDERDKVIKHHWKSYPQKGYNIIISDENRKIMSEIFNSDGWTIKPFSDSINNIMKDIGQKTQDNAWE